MYAALSYSEANTNLSSFGYVTFDTLKEAEAAIAEMQGQDYHGRKAIVNYKVTHSNKRSALNPPSRTLFVGNLAFEMTDADLNQLFREIPGVLDVRVAIDRRSGQPRGFAHADFSDVESAIKAKEILDNKTPYGRSLKVDYGKGRVRTFLPSSNDRNSGSFESQE
jgi:RNA recognition motif-containing protein